MTFLLEISSQLCWIIRVKQIFEALEAFWADFHTCFLPENCWMVGIDTALPKTNKSLKKAEILLGLGRAS